MITPPAIRTRIISDFPIIAHHFLTFADALGIEVQYVKESSAVKQG